MCSTAAKIFVWNTTTGELITMYGYAEHESTTLRLGGDTVVAVAIFGANRQDYDASDNVIKDLVSVRSISEQLDKADSSTTGELLVH